jgi:hypothetical protein
MDVGYEDEEYIEPGQEEPWKWFVNTTMNLWFP